ncbi:hypothetical protein KKG38_00915 [Patescibacteria group bacterium]|nr:hypothetical protein [Patescibacteria group bacterium]MBU1901610.1 hypothetical protein [Patescibacteria group bacterium]
MILSETIIGGDHFCTNCLIKEGENYRQIRLRSAGNNHLAYHMLPSQARRHWKMGQVIILPPFKKPSNWFWRGTHPEDVIVEPRKIKAVNLHRDPDGDRFLGLIEPFTYQSLEALYPEHIKDGGSIYYPADAILERSVGYVRLPSVSIRRNDWGKLRARVEITSPRRSLSRIYDFSIVGKDLRNRVESGDIRIGSTFENVLCRLSLAGPYAQQRNQCYVMLSHIHGV